MSAEVVALTRSMGEIDKRAEFLPARLSEDWPDFRERRELVIFRLP